MGERMLDLAHLTWRGRLSYAYYAARRLVVTPAPEAARCYMGAPIGPHVHCPRRAVGLWCRHHEPRATRTEARTLVSTASRACPHLPTGRLGVVQPRPTGCVAVQCPCCHLHGWRDHDDTEPMPCPYCGVDAVPTEAGQP